MQYNRKELSSQDNKFSLHPWADLATAANECDLIIAEGDGYRVTDSKGKSYIDGIAGMWCVNIGYNREDMAQVLAEQARKLVYYTPFGAMSNPTSIKLAKKLAELSPGDLNRVHFTTGGSTAVESAIRFIDFYFNSLGKGSKKHIISRKESYHGSTYLTASLSGKEVDRTYFNYMEERIHHISAPNPYRAAAGMSTEEYCSSLIEELENKIMELGADNTACFIAEPVMGSGGVLVPPKDYLKKALAVCRKHNVIFILDEVVTGFGRLGHFFSAEPVWGIVPDIITSAKGISSGYVPLGAVLISEKLFQHISGDNAADEAYFTNGFTYSGHPIACAAALKNIEIIENEEICESVREIGPYFIEQLTKLERYEIVGHVRGHHLMACVECNISNNPDVATDDDILAAQTVDKYCEQNGLLVRPYEALCILSPPLIIDKAGVDEMISILAKSIEAATEELREKGKI